MLTRRDFLRHSSLVALAPLVPAFVARTAAAAAPRRDSRALVVVQLDGGNDGINTVVPYADEGYAKYRKSLRLTKDRLVKVDDRVGLHPALRELGGLLEAGQLAVVQGVGYPNPSRSHFESMAVWHTARTDPDDRKGYGWLGRGLDPSAGELLAVGGDVPPALRGRRSTATAFNRVEDATLSDPAAARAAAGAGPADDLLAFVRRETASAHAAAGKLAALKADAGGAGYPGTGLAGRLRLAARLLKADAGARVFYVRQSGYDTHAQQAGAHAELLGEFAGAVAAFFADLAAAKLADRVALLAFSEFGRTVKENGSGGTDHGTAGACFVAGPGVRGGLIGTVPSLTDLAAGEPKPTTDFRRVYAALLGPWLGVPAGDALGGRFDPLPLVRG